MSLPHVLLVDDSEAILAFERAALSKLYAISTATNGIDALHKARTVRPAVILLDLSMPEMDGDEVIERLLAEPELATIPIVVVSSEHGRAQACLAKGAQAFLPKPVTAADLVAAVARALDEAGRRARRSGLAVLMVGVGEITFGLPLDCVRQVLLMPATRPMPNGPLYLCELVELYGEHIAVLDLAARLGVEHAEPIVERKLVVVAHAERTIGLCVDRVRDPEELPPASVFDPAHVGGAGSSAIGETLAAAATTPGGPIAVVGPGAFLSERELATLPALLRQATEGPESAGASA